MKLQIGPSDLEWDVFVFSFRGWPGWLSLWDLFGNEVMKLSKSRDEVCMLARSIAIR